MKIKLLIISIAALCLSAAPAMGGPGGPPGPALQAVLDGITIPPGSSVTVATDYIPDLGDTIWHITGTGGSVSTIIIELTANAGGNVFGLYDLGNPANRIPIFDGTAIAGQQKTLSVTSTGGVYVSPNAWPAPPTGNITGSWFGWYLDSSLTGPAPAPANPNGGVFYSDTALNLDPGGALDHMYAYQGTNDTVQILPWDPGPWTPSEYVLAWEDAMIQGNLPASEMWDYDDFVVMVESVYVPVPGAILLGILGLSVAGIKLRKYA